MVVLNFLNHLFYLHICIQPGCQGEHVASQLTILDLLVFTFSQEEAKLAKGGLVMVIKTDVEP